MYSWIWNLLLERGILVVIKYKRLVILKRLGREFKCQIAGNRGRGLHILYLGLKIQTMIAGKTLPSPYPCNPDPRNRNRKVALSCALLHLFIRTLYRSAVFHSHHHNLKNKKLIMVSFKSIITFAAVAVSFVAANKGPLITNKVNKRQLKSPLLNCLADMRGNRSTSILNTAESPSGEWCWVCTERQFPRYVLSTKTRRGK